MAENKVKFVVESLRRNCIWGTTRVDSRTFVVQHFSGWLFCIMNETDFASYADDNTLYRALGAIGEVIKLLKSDSVLLFKWFSDNHMKANISKCHFLANKEDEFVINLEDTEIKNSEHEKLLVIKIDTN